MNFFEGHKPGEKLRQLCEDIIETVDQSYGDMEERIPRLLEEVYSQACKRLCTTVSDEQERKFYLACLDGGRVATNTAVCICDRINEAWGNGDNNKALALTRVFSLSMLSHLYRWLDKTQPRSEKQQMPPREIAASNLGQFLGGWTGEDGQGFVNLDVEFNYDTGNAKRICYYYTLLAARAGEACGQPSIDFSKISYPVVDLTCLINNAPAGSLADPKELEAIALSLKAGWGVLKKYIGSGNH